MGAPRGTTKLRYAGLALPLHDARTTITFDEHPNQDPALAPKQDLYFGIGRWLTYGQGDLKCRGRVGEVSCAFSLVSCPVYLSPATTRTKPIRLHQVWQPAPVDVDEDDLPDLGGSAPSVTRLRADNAGANGDESSAATRITLRPHDPGTGEEIEKREVVKGYEYSRGQFLTFTAEELKALDVESSKVV